ncbi:MAG: hypothetical protein JW904_00710 [Spirochaetales bacterium]|nr:hypothetical protein [Spirochaetales bacterium]
MRNQRMNPEQMPNPGKNFQHMRKQKKSGPEEIAVGLVATIGFGGALLYLGQNFWWLVFPLIFIGLMPLATGIAKLFSSKNKEPQLPKNKSALLSGEKEILEAVHKYKGRISVLQAAKATSLSIDDARETLESMAKKGYAGMHVDLQGIIQYEFPEFLPEEKDDEFMKKLDE